MTNYGVFRDDFYNAHAVLTASQASSGPSSTGTLTAAMIAGAVECDVIVGNGQTTAQTYTTDTAANIIAQIQTAVATAYKANVGGFASSLGAQPPMGAVQWPNFFNFSWTITLNNQGTTTASTLAAGTGVTIAASLNGLTNTTIPASSVTRYVAQVTGPASVTLTRVQ